MKYTFVLFILLLFSCKKDIDSYQFSENITIYKSEPIEKSAVNNPPKSLPSGMVYVPGGSTQIGAEDGVDWEKPTFWVQVKPFLIDANEVTVGDFRKFVLATNYKTEAEKFGDGGILNEETKQWVLEKGGKLGVSLRKKSR
jgi:sulfatase modifying factor 1